MNEIEQLTRELRDLRYAYLALSIAFIWIMYQHDRTREVAEIAAMHADALCKDLHRVQGAGTTQTSGVATVADGHKRTLS